MKSVINYKHLIIDEKILSRLNYTDHKTLNKESIYDYNLKKNIIKESYVYAYDKLS
jgi:hypothetical protein